MMMKVLPLVKLMGTYTATWTVADVLEQVFISKNVPYDLEKGKRMVTCGTFVVAPLVFGWIQLSRRMLPGNSVSVALKKVLLEQVSFGPLAVSTFYAASCLLEKKTFVEFKEEWKVKFHRTIMTAWCFWPFVQFFNFRYVPHKYNPYVVAVASFFWSIFLCFMKEQKHQRERNVEVKQE